MTVLVTGSNSAAATSVTIPSHNIGDLIMIFAYRDGSTSPPTQPAAAGTVPAWVSLFSGTGAVLNSGFIAWFVATANNHTSGTWANATGMVAAVLTGHDPINPIGTVSGQAASSSSTNVVVTPTGPVSKEDGTSAELYFMGHRTVTAWSAPPAGWTTQTSVATEVCLDTRDNTAIVPTLTQTCTTSGNAGYFGYQVEIVSPGARISNPNVAGATSTQGAAAAAADNVAIPTHAIGDLIVVWAYLDGSTTPPSKPAAAGTVPAWVDIDSGTGGNSNSARSAYFVATATNHTTGSWTGATGIAVAVLTGSTFLSPIGGHAVTNGTATNTATAPAVTLLNTGTGSCILEFYGHRNVTSWGGSAPTNYARRASAATEVCFNTKNDSTSDGSIVQTGTAASGGYYGQTIEITGPTVIQPTGATLTITGGTPTVVTAIQPTGATLTITGGTPVVQNAGKIVQPAAATLTITGGTPLVVTSVLVQPTGATLTITGGTPIVATPILVQPLPVGGDQYWGNVVGLLHLDGTNGSTTFTDVSPLASNWTQANAAVIATAQSKFGGAAAQFPNSNSYIAASAASSNFTFGTGDFTLECWVYYAATNGTFQVILDLRNFGGTGGPCIALTSSGSMLYLVAGVGVLASGGALSTGAWHHVALCRASGSSKLFFDGVQTGSTYADTNNFGDPGAGFIRIGNVISSDLRFTGYIDEVRITKGVARYVSNFTAPTTPFPSGLNLITSIPIISATLRPAGASLAITVGTPIVTTPKLAKPPGANLVLTMGLPIVAMGIRPAGISLGLTAGTPLVTTPRLVRPAGASLIITMGTPLVLRGKYIQPTSANLTTTTGTPLVNIIRLVQPTGINLTLTMGTPLVTAPRLVKPTGVSLSITMGTPIVLRGKLIRPTSANITLTPGTPFVRVSIHTAFIFVNNDDRFRFICEEARTGRILARDLEVSKPKVLRALSGPCNIQFDIDYRNYANSGLYFKPKGHWIHVEKKIYGDRKIWASGLVVPSQVDKKTGVMHLEAKGFAGYPKGLPMLFNWNPLVIDPFEVVHKIWNHVQSYGNGNIGVNVYPALSGLEMLPGYAFDGNLLNFNFFAVFIRAEDKQDCQDYIDKLSRDIPFDYVEQQSWNGDRSGINKSLYLGYPIAGAQQDNLAFIINENVIEAVPHLETEIDWASDVIIDGWFPGTEYSSQLTNADPLRYRSVIMEDDARINSDERAAAWARKKLTRRQTPAYWESIVVDMGHPNAPFGTYDVGDRIWVRGLMPWVGNVTQLHKIIAIAVDEDSGTCELTLRDEGTYEYDPIFYQGSVSGSVTLTIPDMPTVGLSMDAPVVSGS